jgi:hypothetical protein
MLVRVLSVHVLAVTGAFGLVVFAPWHLWLFLPVAGNLFCRCATAALANRDRQWPFCTIRKVWRTPYLEYPFCLRLYFQFMPATRWRGKCVGSVRLGLGPCATQPQWIFVRVLFMPGKHWGGSACLMRIFVVANACFVVSSKSIIGKRKVRSIWWPLLLFCCLACGFSLAGWVPFSWYNPA